MLPLQWLSNITFKRVQHTWDLLQCFWFLLSSKISSCESSCALRWFLCPILIYWLQSGRVMPLSGSGLGLRRPFSIRRWMARLWGSTRVGRNIMPVCLNRFWGGLWSPKLLRLACAGFRILRNSYLPLMFSMNVCVFPLGFHFRHPCCFCLMIGAVHVEFNSEPGMKLCPVLPGFIAQ